MKSTTKMTQNADIKINDNFSTNNLPDGQSDPLLLKPFVVTSLDDVISEDSEIRPRAKGEVFCTIGHKETLTCLIQKTYDNQGNYQNEIFHPVSPNLSPELASHIRIVTFHACHSLAAGFFIYPQKKSVGAFKNSWNDSLEQALQNPPGSYFSLDVDTQQKAYKVNPLEETNTTPPPCDDFDSSLYEALSANIITSVEHPLAQELLQK